MPFKDQHSGGWTGKTARAETWREFDALPYDVKRAYWRAPYKYTASSAVEYFEEHPSGDVHQYVRMLLAHFRRDMIREVKRIYGNAHPQARS